MCYTSSIPDYMTQGYSLTGNEMNELKITLENCEVVL
jgi:hypothetical protein